MAQNRAQVGSGAAAVIGWKGPGFGNAVCLGCESMVSKDRDGSDSQRRRGRRVTGR
jgi:hypothetical protein